MSPQPPNQDKPPSPDHRRCKVCRSSKPLTVEFFPKANGKDEAAFRFGPTCKPCKAESERGRRNSSKLVVQPSTSTLAEGSDSRREASDSHSFSGSNGARPEPRSFEHPTYADHEIEKAINVMRILKRWRDAARANGQIGW